MDHQNSSCEHAGVNTSVEARLSRSVLIFYPTLKTEPERQFWSNFCAQLRGRGYDPVCISFLRPADDFGVEAERLYIPIWSDAKRTPGFEIYGDETDDLVRAFFAAETRGATFDALLEMAATTHAYSKGLALDDIARKSPRYATFRQSALVYLHFIISTINKLRPAFIVVNNDTHPLHLLPRLCGDTLGVPAVHSERSPTVTQWFEPGGFYRDSGVKTFMADGHWRKSGAHEQRGHDLLEAIRAAPAGHRATGTANHSYEKHGSKPRIFLPLDHALATGWSLPSHPLRLCNYPLLSTPEAAIDYFAVLAEKLGAELWVKAHPSELQTATFINMARNDPRLTFIDDGIEEALLTSDVIVGFLTKAACTALALNKAVVTLAPNIAAVSDLTYHCESLDEVEFRVREALDDGPKPDQEILIARFLGHLDLNYFVANDLANAGAKRLMQQHFSPLPDSETRKTAPATPAVMASLDPLAPEVREFDRPGLIFGPFGRQQDRRIEEVSLVEALFAQGLVATRGDRPVMFDVGACVGDAHAWFANEGWEVHAFEPNPPMHEKIASNLGPHVTLNQLAVSDKSGKKVDFFTSEESVGISSMLAFRETHKATATVETIRLDDYCAAQGVDHIDFLKVDTEGFDLFVLKGLNWETHAPSVVVCEFEDNKTRALDYTFGDLVKFLIERGYQVFVSEWHPITRYGAGEHRWRAMHHWPCELFDANAWGNLIAFKTPIKIYEMRHAARFAVGQNFVVRAGKGKLNTPGSNASATIVFGNTSTVDQLGFHLIPPPAHASWIGTVSKTPVAAGDRVRAHLTFRCAAQSKLRLWVGRVGKTPIENVKQVVTAEAGWNHFEIECEFKHEHTGLLIQVGASGDSPVHIGELNCRIEKLGSAATVAAQKKDSTRSAVTYYPPIDSESALIDTIARAAWFLSFANLGRIVVPVTDPSLVSIPWRVPAGMDPAVASRFASLKNKVEIVACADAAAAQVLLEKSTGVLCWRAAGCGDLFEAEKSKAAWLKGKRLWRVDPSTDRNEGALYIEVGFRHMANREGVVERNRTRFDALAHKIGKRQRAYVLATGPSADQYHTLSHHSALGIVCNSVILDDELMRTLKPEILVFADPIFHFGPSEYAATFRQNLRQAAKKYDFTIAIPLKYHDIFLDQLPDLASRMIAVPFSVRPDFVFDLSDDFDVKVTANILTFLMLPLATSFANEIEILGCDGRPLSENTYFWGHNPNTQINDKMLNIQAVHPGFFAIDYNDYYTKHCELLAQQLSEGEAQGRRFVCMAHSHIPALAERMAHDFQPRPQAAVPIRRPRVLVVDSTKVGSLTATGQVKKAFLEGWPPEDVMQISPGGNGCLAWSRPLTGKGGGRLNGDDELFQMVADFGPEVVYHRTIEQRPELREAVWKLVNRYGLPLVSHIMDDWPALVATQDSKRAAHLDASLRALFAQSHSVLSISERMSEAFAKRYGISFTPLANGIDPAATALALEAAKAVKAKRREVVMRYTGALAANMTLDAILDVARAVDSLQGELPIRFEVYTMAYWRPAFEAAVSGLKGISLLDSVPDDEYAALLSEADILVLGYNFDPSSVAYIRYSLPNKLPEYLASGAAVLAYGPRETAAMDLLVTHNLAACVNQPSLNALRDAISSLVRDKTARDTLAYRGRNWVVANRDVNRIAGTFAKILSAAVDAGGRAHQSLGREHHASVDETAVVAHLMQARTGRKHIMVDVGAHVGTSARYFHKLDWTIHCFEPDPANRQKLTQRFGGAPNVTIDPRAVSDEPATGLKFFTSPESTGISGLHAFRDTHAVTATVDATTVADIIKERGLTRVDFLKIDVEGYDLNVLKGVPWDTLPPDVVECEFEDAKTLKLGHDWKHVAEYLESKGYTVYVSEWHPIIRYGIPHDWRRVVPYRDCELGPDAWGNFLAFRVDPGYDAVASAFRTLLQTRNQPAAVSAPAQQAAANVRAKPETLSVAKPPHHPQPTTAQQAEAGAASMAQAKTAPAGQPASARLEYNVFEFSPPEPTLKRPFYAPFGDAVRERAPALFPVLQRARRVLWRAAGAAPVWLAGAGALAALAFIAFGPGPEAARLWLAALAAGAALVLALAAFAWRLRAHILTLSAENRRLDAEIGRIHELAGARENRVERLFADRDRVSVQLSRLQDGQARGLKTLSAELGEVSSRLSREGDETASALRLGMGDLEARLSKAQSEYENTVSRRLVENTEVRIEALRGELQAVRQGLEQRLRAEVDEAAAVALQSLQPRLQAIESQHEAYEAVIRSDLAGLREALEGPIKTSIGEAEAHAKRANDLAANVQTAYIKAKRSGDMIQERMAAAEIQIGALKHPDAPDVFVLFGHHKCGSRFFRNEVFGRIAESTGARVRSYKIDNPPHHYSRLDDLDLPNIDFSGLGENGRDVVLFANATQRSLDKIRRTAGDWRGLRIIRDPRQVLISNYFHHKGDHHTVFNGWVWDQLKHDKPILNELSKEDGILYELDNISKHVIEDLVLAPFDDERVLTLRLEDFSAAPKAHLEQIATFLKVPDVAGLNFANNGANPDSGPWRNHFTSKIREAFKTRYGQALIDLGYEEDMDW